MRQHNICDPIVEEFRRLERIEHSTFKRLRLLYGNETLYKMVEVFQRSEVKEGVIRYLQLIDRQGGALPSHGFSHSFNTAAIAVCKAMNEVPSQYMTHIALAALFHDAIRFYDWDDSAVKQISGRSSSESKESIDLSAVAVVEELNGVLPEPDLLVISDMIKDPLHRLGRYVHFADTVELCNPIRNSCAAYEHKVAKKAGAWWVGRKYYKVFAGKAKELLSDDARQLGATLVSIETLLYNDNVMRDPSQPSRIADTGAHIGVQSLLLESKGSFAKWVAGFDLFGKHDNRLREMSVESMRERTRKDLRRLMWMCRKDVAYRGTVSRLSSGRLHKDLV